jgi:hypothetical protein
VAFVPRRRSLTQIAALAAAVLIASQLGIDHWFYLYLPWFLGLATIALIPRPIAQDTLDSPRQARGDRGMQEETAASTRASGRGAGVPRWPW